MLSHGARRSKPARPHTGPSATGRHVTSLAAPNTFAGAFESASIDLGSDDPFKTMKLRLPIPSTRDALSVTLHAIECSPFVIAVVLMLYAPIAARPASRFRYVVAFAVRVVKVACGVALPKMFATSSLQYTPAGTGFPTFPRHWL